MLAGRDLGSLESDLLLEGGLTSSFEGADVEWVVVAKTTQKN